MHAQIKVRLMQGGDSNFNFLGLSQRIGTACAFAQIFSRHPEWNHPARKINSTVDRKNVHSWKGDTNVENVDLESCWMHGLTSARSVLRQSGIFATHELDYNLILQNEKEVDMLKPDGKTIGVLAGD